MCVTILWIYHGLEWRLQSIWTQFVSSIHDHPRDFPPSSLLFYRQNSETNWIGMFPSMLSPSSPYQQPSSSRGSGIGSNDNFVDEFVLPSSNLEIPTSSLQDFKGILSPATATSGPENRNQYTYRGDHSSDLVKLSKRKTNLIFS